MNHPVRHCCRHFHHHIICEHQIEIEVFPASAEVYFSDEQYADAALSQFRFDAIVYNASSAAVQWSTTAIGGGPGTGSIDQSGLYTAPPMGSLTSGLTEIIIAAAADNPDRKAFAFVTLIGKGPEPPLKKQILITPKRCFLYYPVGYDNAFIDESNTQQVFRAIVSNSDDTVVWFADSVQMSSGSRLYCYPVTGSGGFRQVMITAELAHDTSVSDDALVIIGNYTRPDPDNR